MCDLQKLKFNQPTLTTTVASLESVITDNFKWCFAFIHESYNFQNSINLLSSQFLICLLQSCESCELSINVIHSTNLTSNSSIMYCYIHYSAVTELMSV